MLHNLGCSLTAPSPHQYGPLLHCPGHVVQSLLLQGVVGAGPGAGGGAELLAAGGSITIVSTSTGEEAVLGVAVSSNHQAGGQQARGGGGGEEHLRRVVIGVKALKSATGYEESFNKIM